MLISVRAARTLARQSVRILPLAMALLVPMAQSSCGSNAEAATDTDETVYEDDIDRIEIDSNAGNIEFAASDDSQVRVTREFKWTRDKPASAEVVDDGTLRIELVGCEGWGSNSCGISYIFEIPVGLEIEAHTDAGNITLVGLSGQLVASTDAGNVEGAGLTSDEVEAESRAGNVDLRFVAGTDLIKAHSNAGNVDVAFSEPPSEVEVSSDAGNVTVVVPDDGTIYQVDADSNTSDPDVSVVADEEAERQISASTDAGNVRVDYR